MVCMGRTEGSGQLKEESEGDGEKVSGQTLGCVKDASNKNVSFTACLLFIPLHNPDSHK